MDAADPKQQTIPDQLHYAFSGNPPDPLDLNRGRIFAYVGNLVLLACFLGIGVGCYFSRKKEQILITLGMLVLIALAVKSEPFRHITDMLSAFPDAVIWYQIMEPLNLRLVLQGDWTDPLYVSDDPDGLYPPGADLRQTLR